MSRVARRPTLIVPAVHTAAAARWLSLLGVAALLLGACRRASEPGFGEPTASKSGAAPAERAPAERGAPVAPTAREAGAPKPSEAQESPTQMSAQRGQDSATAVDYRYPEPPRWVAIGDLHGDFAATRAAFRLAGATDAADHWVGGELMVVQTGDQLDRGDGEREILEFLERLQAEATRAHGQLIVLNGNHETMNALGDFRYVTQAGQHAFDGLTPRSPLASAYPGPFEGRAAAFLPGGAMALRLAKRPVVVQVGETILAHAGVRAPHLDFGLGRLNSETAAWLRGELSAPPRLVVDAEGPLWTRVYGDPGLTDGACKVLTEALSRVGAKRMVVGHTVQPRISSACEDRVYRIDVGMSAYYGGEKVEVLAFERGTPRVLVGPREPKPTD